MAIYLWEEDRNDREESEKKCEEWGSLSHWFEMHEDDALVHDIVSNTVCADLLDYVARDNYFCNLGISLEYRFINYLYLKHKDSLSTNAGQQQKVEKNARRRVFVRLWKATEKRPRRDILTDLTRLMDARYMVAERAYFHHAKLVTGAMLGRAVQEYDMTETDESYLYENSDETLLRKLCDWERETGRTEKASQDPLPLATRLSKRKLHKTLEVYNDAAFEGAQDAFHRAAFKRQALDALCDPQTRRDFENWCAAIVGKRPGSVLVYAPSAKMNVKVAQINVHWKGADTTLSEIDDPVVQPRLETVMKAHESLWSIRLMVARDMTQEEKRLLKEGFELRFLVPDGEERARRATHAEQIVEHGIAELDGVAGVSLGKYRAAVRESAETLLDTARGGDAEEKLRAAIRSVAQKLQLTGEARKDEQ